MLLDNGRTRALADEVGRQALRCIRCSACLNVCPGLRADRRPRLRLGLPRPDRRDPQPAAEGHRRRRADRLAALRLDALRRVLRGLPGAIDIPEVLVHLRVAGRRRAPRRPRAQARGGGDAGGGVDVLSARGRSRSEAWAERAHPRRAARRSRRRLPAASQWTAPATCPPPPRESFRAWWRRTVGRLGRPMSAREEILAQGPRRARRRRRPDRCRVPPAPRCATARGPRRALSPSGSRTTARSVERCAADELGCRSGGRAAAPAPRVVVPPGLGRGPRSARRRPGRRRAVGRSSSTASTRSSPPPARRSPRPAPSCSTTSPTRAGGRSRWSPTATSAWSAPTRWSPTSPTPSRCSTRPAAHLDQRSQRHERHRARPGRGRARPPGAARDRGGGGRLAVIDRRHRSGCGRSGWQAGPPRRRDPAPAVARPHHGRDRSPGRCL